MSHGLHFVIMLMVAAITIPLIESIQQLSCNFDHDWCGYQHNEFVERFTGKSPSISSGPFGDHTTGSEGYYALCNGKLLRDPANKCLLYQDVNLDRDLELDFWYYMYGTMIGTLEVILDDEVLWSMEGSRDNRWFNARVTLAAGQHRLTFSANRSEIGRLSSDLAIDDVSIEDHPLTTNIVTPTRTSASPIQLIDSEFDIKGQPDWSSDYLNYEWLQVNGELSHSEGYYGPGSDYTSISTFPKQMIGGKPLDQLCQIPFTLADNPSKTEYYCRRAFLSNKYQCGLLPYPQVSASGNTGNCNMGYYLLMTSDKYALSSFRSRLISPVYNLNGQRSVSFCLWFVYNIFTMSNDGVRVLIEDYENPSQIKEVDSIHGPVDVDRWHAYHTLVVDLAYQQFRIVLEPFRGDTDATEFGSISVDAIRFSLNNCDQFPTTVPTTKTSTTTSTTTTTTTTTVSTTTQSSPVTSTSTSSDLTDITDFSTDSTTSSSESTPQQSEPTTTTTITTTTSNVVTTTTTKEISKPDPDEDSGRLVFLYVLLALAIAALIGVLAFYALVVRNKNVPLKQLLQTKFGQNMWTKLRYKANSEQVDIDITTKM